jgi:hypothetical protein
MKEEQINLSQEFQIVDEAEQKAWLPVTMSCRLMIKILVLRAKRIRCNLECDERRNGKVD